MNVLRSSVGGSFLQTAECVHPFGCGSVHDEQRILTHLGKCTDHEVIMQTKPPLLL